MKNTVSLKLYTLLTVCTAFIFSFSYIGNSVYGKVFNASDTFGLNTKIGAINISEMSPVQALGHLSEEKIQWEENTKITLQYKEKSIDLDGMMYNFQLEKSIENAQSGKENQLIVQLDQEALENLLLEISPELTSDAFGFEELSSELLIYAVRLEQGNHIINLHDFLTSSIEEEIVSESTAKLEGVDHSVAKWTSKLKSIEIGPHSQISMLKIVDENKLKSLDQNTLSIISSSIYQAILSTNFEITERHISRSLPVFAEAGFEAKVDSEKNMDFIFMNPTDQTYSLEFNYLDNLLYVSLKGSKFLYQYSVLVKDQENFEPKKIIQYDAKLPFGTEKTERNGVAGTMVKVYREITDETGNLLKTELISEDFYPPIHEVIVRSLTVKEKTTTTSNEPFENSNTTNNDETNEETADSQADNSKNEKQEEKDESIKAEESDLWGKPDETLK